MFKERPLRILLIDDDRIHNLICERMLRKHLPNLVMEVAQEGFQAVQYLETAVRHDHDKIPDVILLDINMPVMDGWKFLEVFESMAEPYLNTRLLFILSSSMSLADLNKAKANPRICSFISKPLTPEKIETMVQKIEWRYA